MDWEALCTILLDCDCLGLWIAFGWLDFADVR